MSVISARQTPARKDADISGPQQGCCGMHPVVCKDGLKHSRPCHKKPFPQ